MADFNWGSVVGDTIGAVASVYNADQERKAAKEARDEKIKAIKEATESAGNTYDKMTRTLSDYDRKRIRLADDEMVKELKKLMGDYSPEVYDFGKFGDEYTKTVDDFLNPEAEKIAELAGLKTQADLAARGAAKGTGALAGIGYSRWDAAEQLYKDAQQALKDDRAQAYTEYSDYIDNMQKKLDTLNQGAKDRINILSGAVQNEQTAQGDYISDLINLMGDRASTNINATVGAYA